LNVQDLSADAASASGIAKGSLVPRVLQAVQSLLFNRADVWSSISPVMVARLEAIRTRKQNIHYLPNWLNASLANEIAKLPGKAGRGIDEPVRLLYAGNIGGKQDLLRLCQLLAGSNVPFLFRIHGNGAEASSIESWIHSAEDPRFVFGPFLDELRFAVALHETDLFVITEKTGSGGSFIPCKVIASVASGTPILAVCDANTPLGTEVKEYQLGPWFAWDQVSDIFPFLCNLPQRRQPFKQWQENLLAHAAFYERDKVINQFASLIADLIKQ
jgi:colanic acid biosynthesis glycosyl transferase WcaI